MDYTVFILIAVVVMVLSLAFGISYGKKKNYFTNEDLLFAAKALNLSVAIIDELDLKHETQIKTIAKIVSETLVFIESYGDGENDLEEAINYAKDLCANSGVQLTESRLNVLEQLIKIGLEQIAK